MAAPRILRSALLNAILAGLLVAAFFLLLLARDPLLCWRDDYAISVMPVFDDVARAWRHGEWPLLSPYSWACGNLAGEYQYGTFSPAVNLVVVAVSYLPLSLAAKAAALSLSQLVLLAMGACLLARRRCTIAGGGIMVAIIAALNGWNVEWGAADWFGALAANAWLPWCWWAFEEALEGSLVRESPWRWWWRRIFVPTVCVYLLLTGGFPYTVGMLALISAWLAIRYWVGGGGGNGKSVLARTLELWPLAAGWLVGMGLAAPALLSLIAYIPGSDRAHGVNVVSSAWTVPWTALPALILPSWRAKWPDFAGHLEYRFGVELAGALIPLAMLAASAAVGGGRRLARRCGWELGLTLCVLAVCMLPSPGIFRWSFRWLPLFFLALAITAVRAGEPQADGGNWQRRLAGNRGVWAAALAGSVWALSWMQPRTQAAPIQLAAGTMLLAFIWTAGDLLQGARGARKNRGLDTAGCR